MLAVLHRAGELTSVWVPDQAHEAMRDLTRARIDASMQLMRARQQLLAFLLRPRSDIWHRQALDVSAPIMACRANFEQPAHQIVFQDYVEAVFTAQDRQAQLIERIEDMLPQWSMAPLVAALRGLRGLDLISAVTFVAAVGDLGRFSTPRQLMAYLGLVPPNNRAVNACGRGGITKTGNREARRMLVEAAWSYRYPARIAKEKMEIIVRLPKIVREIAWKAQVRLCARYRRLGKAGKKPTVVVTAIARELSGFIWAIGQEVVPASS